MPKKIANPSTINPNKVLYKKRIGRNKIYAIIDSKMKAWLNITIQNDNKPEENTPLRDKIKDFLTNQEK